jgi:hypothetical protein
MRYMILVKANADSEAGVMPTSEQIAAFGVFNEALIQAGVLLAAEGLQSSAHGARVKLDGGKLAIKDGPFAETKELIAGFWLIDVKSYEEAVEWTKRIPYGEGDEYELRKVFDPSDFPADLVSAETLEKEEVWRKSNQKPIAN